MKVALVSPYGEKLVGGIVNWTTHIVDYHKNCDDGVELCLIYNKDPKAYKGDGYILQQLINGVYNYFPVCADFRKRSRREHFDVVHICSSAHMGLLRDLIITRSARKHGIKVVIHLHCGRARQIIDSTGWEHRLFIWLLKRVDKVITMDMVSYNTLKEKGYNHICYLPNPLGLRVQHLIDNNHFLKRDLGKIVFAGHLVPSKGVFELVEACKGIPNITLMLLGPAEGEETIRELQKLAGEDNEKWLSMPGNMPLEFVISEMLTCALFVLPSYSEGFPNVIIESMACGCPIVATSVGAIPEMLSINTKEPCGICVVPRNVNQLREAIVRLLRDRELSITYGKRAKSKVNEEYSVSRVWKQLTDIWGSLIR